MGIKYLHLDLWEIVDRVESIERTSCGQNHTLNDHDVHALMCKNNRRETIL